MPNYNDRRFRAEEARREAEAIHTRHGLNPHTMPHIQALTDYADRLDSMNEREEMRYPGTHSPHTDMEMRRGVPGSGRGRRYYRTRSEMDNGYNEMDEMDNMNEDNYDMEMRRGRGRNARRDRYGRYAENEQEQPTSGYYPYPYHIYGVPMMNAGTSHTTTTPDRTGVHSMSYPYFDPQMMAGEHRPQQKQQIGFSVGQNRKMQEKEQEKEGSHLKQDIQELDEYLSDWLKQKKLLSETGDPSYKKHAELEFEEMVEYMKDLFKRISHEATQADEKQKLMQMYQQLLQNK